MSIKIDATDQAFSDYIRSRDGWECQRCITLGKRSVFRPPKRLINKFPQYEYRFRNAKGLHAMHCFSRGGMAVRYDSIDALAGCYGCHSYLDAHPLEKYDFFESVIGKEAFEELRIRSKTARHGTDKEEIKLMYREKLKELSKN